MMREDMRRIRELLVEWFEELTRDLPSPSEWLDARLDAVEHTADVVSIRSARS